MAIDTSKIDLMGGLDEVVMNQRVRGYVPGTPNVSSGPNTQYGTLWMQGTGVATSLATTTPQAISAAMLGSGIIVQTPGAATAWNLDSAANIFNYMQLNSSGVGVGDILMCDVINSSTANAITINLGANTSFDTGQTQLVMGGNTSRTLFFRVTNTSTPTLVCYG